MSEEEIFNWLEKRKEILENLKAFKVGKDRIKTTTQLIYIHNAIHESLLGWASWLNGWLSIELTKKIRLPNAAILSPTNKELKEIHENLRDFAIKYIEYDIKITNMINKRLTTPSKKEKKEIENKLSGMIV